MNLLLEEEVGQEIDIDLETSEMIVRTYTRDLDGRLKSRETPWTPSAEDLIPRPVVFT